MQSFPDLKGVKFSGQSFKDCLKTFHMFKLTVPYVDTCYYGTVKIDFFKLLNIMLYYDINTDMILCFLFHTLS